MVAAVGAAKQPAAPAASAATDTRPSLVVLPFDNLSDDKEQEYLANGFTEDLTTELARIPGLFVVSRNAAFAYKDKDTKPARSPRRSVSATCWKARSAASATTCASTRS